VPDIGEIRKAKEVGFKGNPNIKCIWHACIKCGKERWIKIESLKRSKRKGLCKECYHKLRGINSSNWKGGRRKGKVGYVEIKLQPDDFFYSMVTKSGYVREHRLVMAKHLGRCLHLWEIVHHKNYIKDDNRIENLQLVTSDKHKQITILEERIKFLENKVNQLKAENKQLKSR